MTSIADLLCEVESIAIVDLYDKIMEEHSLDDFRPVRSAYQAHRAARRVEGYRRGKAWWAMAVQPDLDNWVKHSLLERSVAPIPAEPMRVGMNRRVNRETWKELMARFTQGELDVAFIPTDSPVVAYKDKETGRTVKVEYGRQQT